MKNKIKLLVVLLSFLCVGQVSAQINYTLYSIGDIGGQKTVPMGGTTNTYSYSTGHVGSTQWYQTINANGTSVYTGFPFNVKYFSLVFDKAMFASKGYFATYVQLQWNVVSSASLIKRFKIYRKPVGATGDSLLVASISPDNYSWQDQFAERGVIYKYTLFAEGIADQLRIPFVNYLEGVGFAMPTGSASGRVAFEGGTAVQGVSVVAETDGNLSGKSLYFDGASSYAVVPVTTNDPELELRNGFTVEMWMEYKKTILFGKKGMLFSKGSNYELSVSNSQIQFKVQNSSVSLPFVQPVDTFVHVSAVYNPVGNKLSLYVIKNNTSIDSAIGTSGTQPVAGMESIVFGSSSSQNYFKGYIDEIRLWNKPLNFPTINQNYSRYINGTEANLVGYWRLNEGIGNQFYDFSRKGFTYNENHATIFNGQWTSITPLQSQLGFKGVTDASGNYVISGFPYETDGSLYRFTPMYGVHQFDPAQQIRLISDGTSVINQLDFKDISSFQVTGTVQYRNTKFPVEGVSIIVDGKPSFDKDGKLITTDILGRFSVGVPIGRHSLRVELNGHTFVSQGKFPAPAAGNPTPLYDFQQDISGIEFFDSTLVKLVGRVTGGPVEAAKLLGFGLSKNTIGNANLSLTTEKGYDITLKDSNATYDGRFVNSSAHFYNNTLVNVNPDPLTGEYVTYLIPEKFRVTGVSAGQYTFDPNYNVTIDLKNTIQNNQVLEDTVEGNVKGVPLSYPPYNHNKYNNYETVTKGDTTWTIGIDTFYFQQRQDFIYRTIPVISVLNESGGALFGDENVVYENQTLNIKETIPLINNDAYVFGHPVFTARQEYKMNISLYEEYTNSNTGIVSQVPVTDGKLEIVNNLAIETEKQTIALNEKGQAEYSFDGGLPEINKDPLNPGNSFTKTINITAFSGNNESIKTIWRETDPLIGFLFGGMPVGNNFVTTGPTQVITILRDPPGSKSNASLEKESSIALTTKWAIEASMSEELELETDIGLVLETFAGVGAGVINKTEAKSDFTIGVESEQSFKYGNEISTKYTTTQKWETSEESEYVGDEADVFVGHATNIVYGLSSIIDILPVSSCSNCIPIQYAGNTGSYSIGLKSGLRLNPEISTSFMHTQRHIENEILPNLKQLRNSFLVYSSDPSTVVSNTVSNPSDAECTKNAIIVSLIPETDVKYGSSNTDASIWGNLAASNSNLGNGPSYKIVVANGCANFNTSDTVQYFNQQIKDWEYWLARNEEEKVNATKQIENIAFDAGAKYEKSVTYTSSEKNEMEFEISIKATVAKEFEIDINEIGSKLTTKLSMEAKASAGGEIETESSATYGYVLAESDATDYYSINVRQPDDGFSPVFRINGGVTSCPYQGEYKTKYYKPNGNAVVLDAATVPVDAPAITVDQAVAKDIASNRPAVYNLQLKNNSGIGIDRWYRLRLDDQTNPYGAILEIDGAPIGSGRDFLVKAGQILQKTLTLRMGRIDIMSYEDVKLLFSSQCDEEVESEVEISAYFIPGCSDINLDLPKQNWVLNTNATPQDTLLVKINNYDMSFDNFKKVLFQYKASGSSLWTTNMVFYNPNKVTAADFASAQDPKQWISGPEILYNFDMHSLPDRGYDIRALSICEPGPGVTLQTPTDIISGVKDVKRPQIFGTPQPADGVLSAGDEISVQFDESIEAGLLTPFNFSVQGVLNGYQLNHNTSVDFDGVNDNVRMSDGLNLNSSFTIEFWAKRTELNKRHVVFSKGTLATDLIEIGFNESNQLFVDLGSQVITSTKQFTDIDWYHYAVVYDVVLKKLYAYSDDEYVLENIDVTSDFTGSGSMSLGQSILSAADPFKGNLHELRVWSKAFQIGDVYAQMSVALSGNEINLIGYWPFDEAVGILAKDKARFRNATVNAQWLVLPKGKSYGFDGVDDYLQLNTGSTIAISNEMDFTVEFWFKGEAGQNSVTMFSSGKGYGTDDFNKGSWSIGFNSSGQLEVISSGQYLTVSNNVNLLDDNWHHFGLSVNRKGNSNAYVDGELVKSQASQGFGPLYGLYMWLGARGYKTGSLTTIFDQYFKGEIDEFRIWNLSKKQNQIGLTSNAKLSGSELGLEAYYPFEYYTTNAGIQMMNPTIEDQWKNPYGPAGGTAQAFGGATYSDLTPNIKDARPVQKVNFDWVVNDDKIIITPSSNMALAIDKTILEITVEGVQDKFENRLASPVTWTAYIDKNQLKWGDSKVTLEKKLYQPLLFTEEIINKGGTQQNFTIDNLPSWLTATPASAMLSPLSSMQITFTVNEGLNTGVFENDIYLKSDFGYQEKLIVNLRNYTPIPDSWTVNPDNFQYSMSIDGQIKMNGIISDNPYDYLAAFVGNECRGIAQLQYVKAYDNYQAFMTIYSNKLGGEQLEFKFWNASEGQVHTNVTPNFTFTDNDVEGTPSNPIIFESNGDLENIVDLPQGWKWISFNLYSTKMQAVDNIVTVKGENGDKVKSKLYYDDYDIINKQWIGSLTSNGGLNNKEMYKTYMMSPQAFIYSGQFPDPNTMPITLSSGWNWIGFISRFNMDINEALTSFNATSGDLIKGQHTFATYDASMGWIGNLTYLKPGEGYMYQAKNAGTLVYPKISQLNQTGPVKMNSINTSVWELNPYSFSDNMSLIATVKFADGTSVKEEDYLGAFVNGECRGVVKPIYNPATNDYSFFQTIYGFSLSDKVSFKFYEDASGNEYPINEVLTYQPNSIKGEVKLPVELTVDGLPSVLVTLYPNPFSKEVGININMVESSNLKIRITDLSGRVVKNISNENVGAGMLSLKWDGRNDGGSEVSSGIYVLQVTINGELKNYKIIKN